MNLNLQPKLEMNLQLPQVLLKESNNQYERLKGKLTHEQFKVLDDRAEFKTVIALSDFVANTIFSYPDVCTKLVEQGALDSDTFSLDPKDAVNSYIEDKLSEFELKKRLRILRRTRAMVIAWRDLTGKASIDEVLVSLSNLAEAIVLRTIDVVRAQLKTRMGMR